jgi:ribosomal protein L6P/L9E
MKKELFNEIKIPEGVNVEIQGNLVIIKGELGENKREFNFGRLDFEIKNDKIILGNKN